MTNKGIELSGRKVIVTGGFGALGKVVANAFARAGHRVARVDYAAAAPASSSDMLDIGGVDLSKRDSSDDVVRRVTDAFDGLDILVNIAGGFTWETFESGGPDTWQRMFSLNLLTAATMTKAALPSIQASEAGRIINIGASAAIKADAGMGAYAASKAAVHRLTETLAAELSETAVTVNAILPTIIDTPANRADMPDADFRRWVKPEAISDVILFLASDAARAISGALLPLGRGTPG